MNIFKKIFLFLIFIFFITSNIFPIYSEDEISNIGDDIEIVDTSLSNLSYIIGSRKNGNFESIFNYMNKYIDIISEYLDGSREDIYIVNMLLDIFRDRLDQETKYKILKYAVKKNESSVIIKLLVLSGANETDPFLRKCINDDLEYWPLLIGLMLSSIEGGWELFNELSCCHNIIMEKYNMGINSDLMNFFFLKCVLNIENPNGIHTDLSDLIEFLLSEGVVDIRAQDFMGFTSLFYAIFLNLHPKTIGILVNYGAIVPKGLIQLAKLKYRKYKKIKKILMDAFSAQEEWKKLALMGNRKKMLNEDTEIKQFFLNCH